MRPPLDWYCRGSIPICRAVLLEQHRTHRACTSRGSFLTLAIRIHRHLRLHLTNKHMPLFDESCRKTRHLISTIRSTFNFLKVRHSLCHHCQNLTTMRGTEM